jgi:hypothetical protein
MGQTTPRNHVAFHVEAILRWVEREFTTPISHIIHGRDEERGGYTIIVRTSGDPLMILNQLVMVTLLDEFLCNHTASESARWLEHWRVGDTMKWAGCRRVVVTRQGPRLEAR